MDYYNIIQKPVLTEKSMAINTNNQHTFIVSNNANKVTVGKAIELLYGVKPKTVNIISVTEKKSGRGRVKRKPQKKAIVTLKPKDKIDPAKLK